MTWSRKATAPGPTVKEKYCEEPFALWLFFRRAGAGWQADKGVSGRRGGPQRLPRQVALQV
jgi:hypothetical protein